MTIERDELARVPSDKSVAGEIRIFDDCWQCYQWLLQNNALGNQDLVRKGRELLQQTFSSQGLRMVDLGCGDACSIPPLTSGSQLTSYKGIDLLETQFSIAENHLKTCCNKISFEVADIFQDVTVPEDTNLLFSSFAMHHGQQEQKQQLFRALGERVQPGTVLMLFDTVLPEHQSLSEYIDVVTRYYASLPGIKPEWTALINDHINHFDFPETSANLLSMADQAGWGVERQWHTVVGGGFPISLFLWKLKG